MRYFNTGHLCRLRLYYLKIYLSNLILLLLIIVYIHYNVISQKVRKVVVRPDKFCTEYKPSVIYENLIHIPSMNILFCHVLKAASTNLRRVLHAHLFPNLYTSRSKESPDRAKVWRKLEEDFKQFYLHNDMKSQSIITNQTLNIFKFLLVRHPFQRIYSAFNDKFVHNHVEDVLFGWKEVEEGILLQMHPNETILSLRRRDARLDLQTFLRFRTKSIRQQQPIGAHWDQIVTRCAICHIDYDWIGKIENLKQDGPILLRHLKGFNEQNFSFPSSDLDEAEYNRTNFNDEQIVQLFRETLNNQDDFRVLVNYYLPDFQAFRYSIPNV